MARILITGAADGLGLEAARQLVAGGHEVVAHARSPERAEDARSVLPGLAAVVSGELSSLAATRALATAADELGPFDGVIHNAGVGHRVAGTTTQDGFPTVFQVNVLAPYVLTALMARPEQLVYLSSGLHHSGDPDLSAVREPKQALQAYSDSKLLDTILAFAVARLWPGVRANAVDPGWVATKMGGTSAPDDLHLGGDSQAWLASGGAGELTGALLHHREQRDAHPAASDPAVQDELLATLGELSGVPFPAG